ncbi:MAG: orotidine 5'-phosphate decarboxylase / HUMPS family protein, partial [Parcubacteria group bacterium]
PDSKKGENRDWLLGQVLTLAEALEDTGVSLKVESSLRSCGYDLITMIHRRRIRVFADLKLTGTREKLSVEGALLREFCPDFVTVSCASGVVAMKALKAELPTTSVLGVTVLTSFTDRDAMDVYLSSVEQAVMHLAQLAEDAGLDGLILAPREVGVVRALCSQKMTLNTPGIRSPWMVIEDDDQNLGRAMTPKAALEAGADRLIVERAVTQSSKPRDVVQRLIEEIASVKP